eukprot:scaffold6.g2761.t1
MVCALQFTNLRLFRPSKPFQHPGRRHGGSARTHATAEANRRHDLGALLQLLDARRAAGLPPDSYTHSALIAGLGRAGLVDDALALFWEACRVPDAGAVSLEVCNATLAACAARGDWDAAQTVVAVMRERGIDLDVVSYNALIKAAGGARRLPEACALYGELAAVGLRPSPVTFASLFAAAARAGGGDATWLLRVYDEMSGLHGVQPNDLILSAFFAALGHAPCSPAQLERALGELEMHRARDRGSHRFYASLLAFVQRQVRAPRGRAAARGARGGREGRRRPQGQARSVLRVRHRLWSRRALSPSVQGVPERAVDIWNAAQQDRVPPSPHLYSALFAACSAGRGSPALAEVAAQAAAGLRQWWGQRSKRMQRGSRTEERDALFAFNSLLHYLGGQQALGLKHALAVYAAMRAGGPTPDAVTFNTLIGACALARDVAGATRVFSDMIDAGVEPTELTFGALINCHAKARQLDSARMIFGGLQQLGFEPNVQLYTSLMDAAVKQNDEAGDALALQLLDDMRAAGLQPSAVTYGTALGACSRRGDVETAFALYQQACQEGIVPTDELHDLLLKLCVRAGRLSEGVDLVKALARQHSTLQEATLNSLVRALCSRRSAATALRLLSLIEAWGMRPSRRTYLALIAALAQDSNSQAAYQLYRAMRALGLEVDAPAGSALIIALCRAGQLATAVSVYDDMIAVAWRLELSKKAAGSGAAGAAPGGAGSPGGAARARARVRSALSKRAQLPDGPAVAEMVERFAAEGQLRPAFKYYQQLRKMPTGLSEAAATHRRAFELLIESSLRARNFRRSLVVFDDWKGAAAQWLAAQRPGAKAGAAPRPPRLSYVTLAFLEACCRTEPEHAWRVYDVLAVIRQQRERKTQAELARPQKESHHVLGSVHE